MLHRRSKIGLSNFIDSILSAILRNICEISAPVLIHLGLLLKRTTTLAMLISLYFYDRSAGTSAVAAAIHSRLAAI